MDKEEFEYDVASSFHSQDEGLATTLNDLIQDRFKTFLYSRKQEVLAGTDGEETFNRIFGKQARLVVIFVRKEWGETPFTRIEQTAIRNRAFDNGFDFTLFIPTDDLKELPPWVPKTRLWFGLERFGLQGAAAVIEARLQELGSEPRVESVADRAARFERARQFQAAKDQFEHSFEGVQLANQAFDRVIAAMGHKVEEIARSSTSELQQLRLTNHAHTWLLRGLDVAMTVEWRRNAANSLAGARVMARTFDGVPSLPGIMVFDQPNRLQIWQFEYSLLSPGRQGYVSTAEKHRSFTDDELADHLLKQYLDTAEKQKRR